MKTKTLILLATLLLSSVALFAQEGEKTSCIKYANITEFGFFATSPKSIYAEGTTVHGISLNKKHVIGLGIGIGGGGYFTNNNDFATAYMPMFINYRCYFLPDRKFSPHINVAAGGLFTTEGEGIYSALTAGFKSGKFTFSSGFSFLGIYEKIATYHYPEYPYNYYGGYTTYDYKWYFPMGITMKAGFTF
jgi:hypothetical protein